MTAEQSHRAQSGKYSNRMSIPEFAKALECSEQVAYRMVENGRFGSFKEGNVYFVSRRAVMNWVEGKQEPTHEIKFLRRFPVGSVSEQTQTENQ
jgi:excisionase family DNA binding protein